MAFIISNNQPPFSGDSADVREPVSTQLSLKPSPESLDKEVVLRRLRHHKTMTKVKHAFQAMVGAKLVDTHEYEDKWLQLGDSFTSP